MKNKPIVLFDLDNVLADFSKEFIKTSRRMFAGRPVEEPLITDFHYHKCGIWTEKECNRIIAYTKGTRNFWMQLDRMPKTNLLSKHYPDMNVFFATARYQTDGMDIASQSAEWLYKQYAIRDAFVIPNPNKGIVAADIDAEWAIDDRMENVISIVDAVPKCKTYILDQTYNRSLNDKRIKRVSTVNEFIGDILNVSK